MYTTYTGILFEDMTLIQFYRYQVPGIRLKRMGNGWTGASKYSYEPAGKEMSLCNVTVLFGQAGSDDVVACNVPVFNRLACFVCSINSLIKCTQSIDLLPVNSTSLIFQ